MWRRWISAPVRRHRWEWGGERPNVERPCSRGPDETLTYKIKYKSSIYLYTSAVGRRGTVAGDPRGVLFNDIAPRSVRVYSMSNLLTWTGRDYVFCDCAGAVSETREQ